VICRDGISVCRHGRHTHTLDEGETIRTVAEDPQSEGDFAAADIVEHEH
jgi:hypothetical protein